MRAWSSSTVSRRAWSTRGPVPTSRSSSTRFAPTTRAAGTVRRVEVGDDVGVLGESPGAAAGSHALGVGTAAALGRALGRMPARLVVFAVEGANFDHGEELSQPVRRAVTEVTARIAAEIAGSC